MAINVCVREASWEIIAKVNKVSARCDGSLSILISGSLDVHL